MSNIERAYHENGNIYYEKNGNDIKYFYPDGKPKFDGKCAEKHDVLKMGKCFDSRGNIYYQGNLENNYPHGHGITYHANGQIKIDGTWCNNKVDGYAKECDEHGKIVYYGYWKDDSPYLKLSDESYETDNIGSSNDETCCICLDNKCDVVTKCNHTFCYECLSKNYEKKDQKCPLCRQHYNTVKKIDSDKLGKRKREC